MSTLTEAVVYVTVMDEAEEDRMAAAMAAPVAESGQAFAALDVDAAGGSKHFCGAVYAACFKYVLPDDVEAFVRDLPWGDSWGVLVIDYEHDDGLRVIRVP